MGSRKYTDENFNSFWQESNCDKTWNLVHAAQPINANSLLILECKVCEYHHTTNCNNLFHRKRSHCPACDNTVSRYRVDNFLNIFNSFHKSEEYDLLDFSNVKSNKSKIRVRHKICGFEHLISCQKFFDSTRGCKRCNNREGRYTQENFMMMWANHKNSKNYILLDFSNVQTNESKFKLKHIKCGYEFETQCHSFFNKNTGCPKCNRSRGEQAIENYLFANQIKYTTQFIIEGCVDKRSLPFDFYLPNLNLIIEFHGNQHYHAVEKFGGIVGFEERKRRDVFKKECSSKAGHNFLEIKYTDYKKIEKILKKTIEELQLWGLQE